MLRLLLLTFLIASTALDLIARPTTRAIKPAEKIALTLYVAPTGRADWNGTQATPNRDRSDGPLPSLFAARDRIRAWRTQPSVRPGRIEVRVLAGLYPFSETLVLGPEDSGTPENPVIYRAYGKGLPRMIGATVLFPESARRDGKLLVFPLPLNLQPSPGQQPLDSRLGRRSPTFELFWNRQRLTPARWPNLPTNPGPGDGWAYVEAVPTKGSRDAFIAKSLPSWFADETSRTEIYLFPGVDWFDQVVEVANYDRATGRVTLARPTRYPINAGDRFFVSNTRQALDQPGEWWFDTANNVLFVRPPDGSETAELLVSRLPTLLQLSDVRHITIAGIAWEACTGDAIRIENAADCRLDGNIIMLTGGNAIVAQTDAPLTFSKNVITATGLAGMRLTGGDRQTLTPSQMIVADNVFSRLGQRVKCYKPAVGFQGVGITITHNHIFDLPHSAIMFSGNNHVIANNLIENIGRESNDVGAIYAGRDWSSRGTRIEGNVFRTMRGWKLINRRELISGEDAEPRYASGNQVHAVYLDDLQENSVVRDNVFIDIISRAVHFGGGSYHTVVGNYFVRCGSALFISERRTYDTQLERLKPFDHPGSPYRAAYPEIVDREKHNPLTPSFIRFEDNHLIEVPLAYDIWIMSRQNSFSRNRFIDVPASGPRYPLASGLRCAKPKPQITAILLADGKRERLSTWQAWQSTGFDRDPVLQQKLSKQEQITIRTLLKRAHPR